MCVLFKFLCPCDPQNKAEDVADEGPIHEDNEWGITLEEEYVPQDSTEQRQVAEGVQVNNTIFHFLNENILTSSHTLPNIFSLHMRLLPSQRMLLIAKTSQQKNLPYL